MKNISLYILIFLMSCQIVEELPIDYVYVPNPTMDNGGKVAPDSLLVQIVACDTVVTQPEFITVYNEYFNGVGFIDGFYFQDSGGIDTFPTFRQLLEAQGFHPDSIEIYTEGNSIAAIIRGTNDKSGIEGKIWTWDAVGQKALYTVNIQAFLFGGALEYEEFKQVAIELQSVAVFNFRNTNWTQEQYEEISLIILGECKLGRRDANFAFNAFPISDSLYCAFIHRDWQVVRGQVENCNVTPFYNPERT